MLHFQTVPREKKRGEEHAVKEPEPRAPELESPRPMGAGVGARPKPVILDSFARAMKELLSIDIDEVAGEGGAGEQGGEK